MNVRVLLPPRIDGTVPEGEITTLRGRSMGCGWSVALVAPSGMDCAHLTRGIEALLMRVVDQMSTWEADSIITHFNRAAAGSWLPLPPDFALVLACALSVARATGGALDPTMGALVRLWGFGAAGRHHQPGFVLPAEAQIASARKSSGWQRLKVDTVAMRLQQPGGLELDLSAVAKGFAVDEVCRFLRGTGIAHHLVDIGGELRGAGMKADGQPWWVEVQNPPGSNGIARTRIALHNLAVATSGDYLQGFRVEGRSFSHCIDPRTGTPIDNGVCSVTVLHDSCMEADAWSTALMVLGPAQGMDVAEDQQLAAQWLVRADAGADMQEYLSSAYTALLAKPQ